MIVKKIKNILDDEHFGEILKGTSIVFILRIVSSIIAFFLTFIIVKQLGAEKSGYYFFIISFLMFLSSFASFGLFNAMLKEVSIHKNNNNYISNLMTRAIIIIAIGTFSTGLIIYIYNLISIKYGFVNDIINNYIYIIIFSLFPFTFLFLFSNYFQAVKKLILSMIMLNLGYQFIMLSCLTIYQITTTEDLLFIFDIAIILILILGFYILYFKHKSKILLTTDKTFFSLLSLSVPMMIAQIVSQINNFSGQLLLSIYTTPTEISLFSVSMRIAILMTFLIMAVNRVVAPKFAILYKESNLSKLEEVVMFSNRLLLFFSLPILIIIIIFGKEILGIFGPEFESAYYVLLIITVGQFIASISGTVVFLLQMTGSEKVIRNNIIISTSMSILVGIIIVPLYGILGAAIMTLISLSTVNLLSSYKAYKILGINPLKLFKIKGNIQ